MTSLHFSNRMNYEDYIAALISGKCQFSITPLGGEEDEESWFFNSCKNPFKYLNYEAARVPGIYSSTPIYESCVSNYDKGILVKNSESDWCDSLLMLAGDKGLRQKIRKNAYEDVMENHNIKRSADELIGLLE